MPFNSRFVIYYMMVPDLPNLSKELVKKMENYPEVNWEGLIEDTIRWKLQMIEDKEKSRSNKAQFFHDFCGVIEEEIDEISNLKEIWVQDFDK